MDRVLLLVVNCKFDIIIDRTIDNSRNGLDTSKNQCSASAVTALKKYWRYHVYNLFRLKNSSNVFSFIIIIGCLTGNIILFWNKKKTRGWNVLHSAVNCLSETKKEKELMTKGITPSCKKHASSMQNLADSALFLPLGGTHFQLVPLGFPQGYFMGKFSPLTSIKFLPTMPPIQKWWNLFAPEKIEETWKKIKLTFNTLLLH